MNNKILKQIKSLPPLPKSVLEVQRITNDPNSSIADLVKVIKEDPMLTANLLKAANSPLYGFTRQIKTVDQAVSLFGMTTVKGFVISFAVRNTMKFDLSAYGITEQHFHDISMKRNALAVNWYKRDKNRLEIIATDSFLIDLGAVIISLILNSEGKNEDFRKRLNKENRYNLEKEFLGSTTPEITAEIFKYWHFGEDLIIPIQNILTPQKAGKYEQCAKSLDVIRIAFDMLGVEEADLEKAFKKAEEYGLDKDALNEALEKMK
jgi:HD-like signal output (HDOD) protein